MICTTEERRGFKLSQDGQKEKIDNHCEGSAAKMEEEFQVFKAFRIFPA
jgi:hypothetical protein